MNDQVPVKWKDLIVGTVISVILVTLAVLALLEWMEG